ncbi:MAG: hypothetical protein HC828_18990 [Blastochloris sp.]|nr:hypothetical protein [Blastochloris sp.]
MDRACCICTERFQYDWDSNGTPDGYDRTTVPAEGETVYLRSTANLSTGGTSIDRTNDIHYENRELARRAAMVIGLDIAGIALPLGQAIGRWANYINGELYGVVTTLPWGITIASEDRVEPYRSLVDYPVTDTRFHPLFLYESLWNFIAFIVLLTLYLRDIRRPVAQRRFRQGDFFLLYIMQYTFVRFLLEFIRVEVAYIPGTTINLTQILCVIAFGAAFFYFILRRRQPAPTATAQPGKTA